MPAFRLEIVEYVLRESQFHLGLFISPISNLEQVHSLELVFNGFGAASFV